MSSILTESITQVDAGHATCLQSRTVKNIKRDVFRIDETDIVVKRYTRTSPFPDRRALWKKEHRVLCALGGSPFPVSHGWTSRGNRREFFLCRSLVEGEPLEAFTSEQIPSAAQVMWRMHAARVSSCDPATGNFLKTPDGELSFIDFSRARLFRFRSPLMMVYLGKELARFHRTGVQRNAELWHAFLDTYMQQADFNKREKSLVQWGLQHWQNLWKDRPAGR